LGWSAVEYMKSYAILFAGQGAQQIGMGVSAINETPELKPYFDTLQNHLHFSLTEVLTGSQPGLNQTRFTQPSLLVTSLLYMQQLKFHLAINPQYYLGFSLGEYTALHLSGHVDLATILELIQQRAQFMEDASNQHPGSMAAILGLEVHQLETLCSQVSRLDQQVLVANYNCPGQYVISGHQSAVKEVMTLALASGAKRALPLNVSGAFHSPLMQSASDSLKMILPKIHFQAAHTPMIFNVTGSALALLQDLPELLIQQVKAPVQFEKSIRYLNQLGIFDFLEIGPGSVLSGLVKKIIPEARVLSYNGINDLAMVKEWLTT
jgi:[acyl-carrier-protein] S-malonyltransferase